MLPELHNRAYQDFSAWLIKLDDYLQDYQENQSKSRILQKSQELENWFEINVASLNSSSLQPEIIGRWQSVQIEIRREFKLLTMDILFLSTARQKITQVKRLAKIRERITKLNSYCQIMNNKKEANSD